jgi:ribonuclease VapC
MFIDASAIVAILGREPGYEELEKRLSTAGGPFFVSPLVKFEASVALARLKATTRKRKPSSDILRQAQRAVDAFIEDVAAEEIPISAETGRTALDACTAYGKAVGHVADLNFGDCFSYACAKTLKTLLLYKGNDFSLTDLA